MKNFQILYIFIALISISSPLTAQTIRTGLKEVKYDGKNFYAVLDQQYKIVKMNKRGDVLSSYGRRGKGPDEFYTAKLTITLTDSLVYVLDKRGLYLTVLRKKNLSSIRRKSISKPASKIILYDQKLYGYVMDFETENPLKTGYQTNVFRGLNQLNNVESTLFRVKDPHPINPFYDAEAFYNSHNIVLITREGKNSFIIFHDNSLEQKKILGIEQIALGSPIKSNTDFLQRPMMKILWKKKIIPLYKLLKSAYIEKSAVYFQVHSYKKGDALIRYDTENERFKYIGVLKRGKMLAVDKNTVYSLLDGKIIKTTLSKIRACSKEPIIFYLNSTAFSKPCLTCEESFLKWYDFAMNHNIPTSIVLEDDSWFGTKEVDAIVLKKIIQWNLWGKVSYQKGCNNCFQSNFSVSFQPDNVHFYTFPKPLSILKKRLSCINK